MPGKPCAGENITLDTGSDAPAESVPSQSVTQCEHAARSQRSPVPVHWVGRGHRIAEREETVRDTREIPSTVHVVTVAPNTIHRYRIGEQPPHNALVHFPGEAFETVDISGWLSTGRTGHTHQPLTFFDRQDRTASTGLTGHGIGAEEHCGKVIPHTRWGQITSRGIR